MSNLICISEAAQLLGVSESTLRLWDKNNILKPKKTPTGHRRYNLEDILNMNLGKIETNKIEKIKANKILYGDFDIKNGICNVFFTKTEWDILGIKDDIYFSNHSILTTSNRYNSMLYFGKSIRSFKNGIFYYPKESENLNNPPKFKNLEVSCEGYYENKINGDRNYFINNNYIISCYVESIKTPILNKTGNIELIWFPSFLIIILKDEALEEGKI